MRCILLILEAVSRLKVNLNKSMVFPLGCISNMEELASIMGCVVESFPTTYLGLPLGAKPTTKRIPVIERMEKRLSCWKGRFLSKGGKLVLLRSVLSSITTYYLSLFVVPVSVSNRIEWIQRDFLRQAMQGEED